ALTATAGATSTTASRARTTSGSPPGRASPTPSDSGTDVILTFTVRGIPAPQGSKRHVGNGVMVESSKRVKPWRDAVRSDAVAAMSKAGIDHCGFDGPLVLDVVFYFARPKSHYRTGANSHLLRDGAPAAPMGPPDLSKLVRSTEDAL